MIKDHGRNRGTQGLDDKVSALQDHWLRGMEYYGPLSPEQEKRYQWYRWFSWKELSDEAVSRWGISELDANMAAEAAVARVDGLLRYLARLIALENLVEGETR